MVTQVNCAVAVSSRMSISPRPARAKPMALLLMLQRRRWLRWW